MTTSRTTSETRRDLERGRRRLRQKASAGGHRPERRVRPNRLRDIRGLTSFDEEVGPARPRVEPDKDNGLLRPSRIMVDKIVTLPRRQMGKRIGRLADADLDQLDRALIVFLDLIGPAPGDRRP